MSRVRDMVWPSRMAEEEWAEVSQDIPAKDEPFINKFLSGREALIAQEKQQRSDHAFRQSLSPLAKEACSIVDRIRQEEQRTIWTSEFEDILAQKAGANVYPGMMFSFAKERMEKTKLWQIIRKMPKGALLHAHMDAMVDFDYLFEVLLSEPGMHIHCMTSLSTPAAREGAPIKFRYCKSEQGSGGSIWSSDYKPDTPILLSKAVESFPDGGKAGFLSWLKDRCTITNIESIEHHHGVDAVWRKFSSVFTILNTIIFYEPIFRKFMRRMMQQLLADGVKWVDLRLAFTFFYYAEGQDTPEPSYERMFKVFGEEIEKFKASEEGKEFWGCRMIWTGIRVLDTRKIVEDMDQCIFIKQLYPELVSGYDLVGQEDAGRPLKDLLPELFWFKKQCAQEGIDIPFFFHAGECLGDGSDTDQNLFDAVLLGTRRIGHGFSLYKHPLLIDMVKEKRILVESCPISNEVLRLCASVMSHPLPALLARGVSCSLCNDDPAILGQDTAGMTHDFWQALQGWDNLGLAGLASLAENSVRWAAFEDQNAAEWLEGVKQATLGNGVRAERMKQWSVEWEQFCLWIVTEHGDDADSLKKLMAETSMDIQD
ncbi:adenosine deaminase family protein-like protein [Mollisia scopiformis]|uniref:adenosine deaminase n=1 Tax=Mollisia scopiformis TaxID=149040 RepID=A0A194XD77_MOLSC|nr:adenosine deaminase family protein-like protein [Mollisia scopiformis]KUJ18130.1 adenosine deaminase family protein-like protein [Mollisia scopiformis]